MEAAFVLLHSPSVGPLTWAPVEDRLRASGAAVIVPSLVAVADAEPPIWRAVARTVAAAADRLPPGRPVVLVAHSNAGLFVPVVVEALGRPVAGCLFVDTPLPARAGATPVASPEFLAFLRAKAVDGRLPQWTQWWDDADVAPMFPDPQTRRAVSAEQPRLPLSYYEAQVPAPAGWDAAPCGYLLFGPPYEPEAEEAGRRGWDVEHVPGEHLHQIVDPDAVTARIRAMAARWSPPAAPRFRAPQVVLFSEDLPRAARFYRRLGFTETFRVPAEGDPVHVDLQLDGYRIGIATADSCRRDHGLDPVTHGQRAAVVLWTDDTAAAYAAVTAAGATALAGPHEWLGRLLIAWIADPDGNPVQIVQSLT